MKTLYNTETGEAATFHSVDAKECLARGGWSDVPIVAEKPPADVNPLAGLKVSELREYAKANGITLGADATTRDAILAVIQAAEAKE